jgi:hypothetical protein
MTRITKRGSVRAFRAMRRVSRSIKKIQDPRFRKSQARPGRYAGGRHAWHVRQHSIWKSAAGTPRSEERLVLEKPWLAWQMRTHRPDSRQPAREPKRCVGVCNDDRDGAAQPYDIRHRKVGLRRHGERPCEASRLIHWTTAHQTAKNLRRTRTNVKGSKHLATGYDRSASQMSKQRPRVPRE